MLYRLAPEHPFPAAVDDSVAVYKALLKVYKPEHIVIYGTSAGAILTAEVAVKLKQLGLPHAGGAGHFQRHGRLCARRRLHRHVCTARPRRASRSAGTRSARSVSTWLDRPKDPVLSPIYADLHGLPPTLFVTSGRDLLLSGTANLHRAYLECRSGCAPGGV